MKINIRALGTLAVQFTREHTPLILTATAVGGVIGTTILAAKAAPKAKLVIEEKEEEHIPRPWVDYPKWTWKVWLPTAASGALTITSIIMIHYTHQKRYAALMGLYAIGTQAFQEYRESVEEVVDEKTQRQVREKVFEKSLPDDQERAKLESQTTGKTLTIDLFSGRSFVTDIESVRRAENLANKKLLAYDYLRLNEVYMLLGLDPVGAGEDIGWNSNDLIEINTESMLTSDGTPAMTIDFYGNLPREDFHKTK